MAFVKLFSSVKAGDRIYYLSPSLNKIKDTEVLRVAPYEKQKGYVVITCLTNLKDYHSDISKEMVKRAVDDGVTATKDLILPAGENFAMLMQEVPTVICTEEQTLRKWIKETK